jgi:putative DNA primase/helicase
MSAAGALASALKYAARDCPVFPVGLNKVPITAHGRSDATLESEQIREWWRRWPDALIGLATGAQSGIVALDIDISDKVHGPDSLDALGVAFHPETPTAHTPRGGYHMLFRHPGHFVKTIAGKLGPGLDIRGDGGSIIVPPGPGRFWDPVYGLDYPLADMPEWMVIPEPPAIDPGPAPTVKVRISRYGEAALDGAVYRIVSAPAGAQETTLNREVYSIGRLAGGGEVDSGLALETMLWAGRKMPAYDASRPWRPAEVEKKVKAAFADGLIKPRRRA